MKLISLLLPYVIALILTLIIEGALCLLIKKSRPWLKFTCLVNLFTNPLVNFIYALIFLTLTKHGTARTAPHFLILLEIMVWLFESWLFYRFQTTQDRLTAQSQPGSSMYNALLFSFILNAASYGTVLLLQL